MCVNQPCVTGSGIWDNVLGPGGLPFLEPEPQPVDTWSLDLNGLMNEVGILMRDRHKKYGNGNISKRGIPGILVRLDDKLARIDNGDLDYADESYRDAWLDVVGYGLVALMCLDGNWPGVERPSRDLQSE